VTQENLKTVQLKPGGLTKGGGGHPQEEGLTEVLVCVGGSPGQHPTSGNKRLKERTSLEVREVSEVTQGLSAGTAPDKF
jgi:hypothetical protein